MKLSRPLWLAILHARGALLRVGAVAMGGMGIATELAGAAMLTYGISLIHMPSALVVGGLALIFVAQGVGR